MPNDTRADHVQRYVTHAVQKVLSALNNSALERMLPERALVPLQPIPVTSDSCRGQLDAGVTDVFRWRAGLVKIARVGLSLTVTSFRR